MVPVKRVELVIEAAHTPELLERLREADVPGYTVVRDVQGTGDRGERGGDQLTDVYRNCLVIIACDPATAERIIKMARPLLTRYGGLCLVSDATLLKHRDAGD